MDDALPDNMATLVLALEATFQPATISLGCVYNGSSELLVAVQTTLVKLAAPIPIYLLSLAIFLPGYIARAWARRAMA